MTAHAEKRVRYSFALAHIMHIRPWEIDLLTYEQFEGACAAIDKYQRQIEAANKPAD